MRKLSALAVAVVAALLVLVSGSASADGPMVTVSQNGPFLMLYATGLDPGETFSSSFEFCWEGWGCYKAGSSDQTVGDDGTIAFSTGTMFATKMHAGFLRWWISRPCNCYSSAPYIDGTFTYEGWLWVTP